MGPSPMIFNLRRRNLFLLAVMCFIHIISSFQAPSVSTSAISSRFGESILSLKMSSEPGQEDQVAEAIRSLCDYHEGQWEGTAKSFSVLPDVAAGIVQRKMSPSYKVSVKLGLDSNRDYSFTETFAWDDKISSRSLSLNDCNVDVDSVDASYSLDSTLPDFPSDISGTDKLCKFAIEHCIAAGEHRRTRCFMLYGVDQSLQRIVVCDEERKASEQAAEKKSEVRNNQLTALDLLEMESDIDRLVNKVTGNVEDESGDNDNDVSNLDLPEPSQIEKLGQSMTSSDGTQPLSSHDISLLELSSGVWLGDAIIRDMPMVPESPSENGKGFGPVSERPRSSSKTKTFGTWSVGLRKISWRWMWNFGDEIRQVMDFGKSMGADLATSMTKTALAGTVCVNESLSRRIPKDERMVYVDWTGDMVSVLSGSVSIQAPRYLNFDKDASKKAVKPFFTEFCLYQATEGGKMDASDENESSLPELCCSKISRVYNYAGQLKQGISSFYTFKRFGVEEE
jgi:hypothetical protein